MAKDWLTLNEDFQALLAAKDYLGAEAVAKMAIDIFRAALGPTMEKAALADLAWSYANFASLRTAQGRFEEAGLALQLATTIGLHLDLGHPAVIATLQRDMELCKATQREREADGIAKLLEVVQAGHRPVLVHS